MGRLYTLQCEHCGNEWDHYEGVGDRLEPYPIELLDEDETCDAQMDIEHLKCPKCQSDDIGGFSAGMWD